MQPRDLPTASGKAHADIETLVIPPTKKRSAKAAKRPTTTRPAAKKRPAKKAAAKKRSSAKAPASASTLLVVTAVRRELAELERRTPGIASSPEASMAIALAKRLDQKDPSALAICARRLHETMEIIRGSAKAGAEDVVDEVARKRRERLAAQGVTGTQ